MVREAEPEIAPLVAEMVTLPAASVVARPELSIEAIELSDDAHVT